VELEKKGKGILLKTKYMQNVQQNQMQQNK
jgi:hypothetical protein